jgi:hypothetical protein
VLNGTVRTIPGLPGGEGPQPVRTEEAQLTLTRPGHYLAWLSAVLLLPKSVSDAAEAFYVLEGEYLVRIEGRLSCGG